MKKPYYLFNPGRLSRKDNTLQFILLDEEGNEKSKRAIPIEGVDELFVFGSLDANSALYNFLGKHHIQVHFFDYYEHYTGSFLPRDYLLAGKVLINQTKHYIDTNKRNELAKKFIQGASDNILKNLKYYASRGKDLQKQIQEIEMLKLCRKYLTWIQNSVFEGEITEVKLKELTYKARKIMDETYDSIIVFKTRQEKWLDKEIIGLEKNSTSNIL